MGSRDMWMAFKDLQDELPGVTNEALATLVLAMSMSDVAHAIHRLGNADAATHMGGLEALGAVLKEGCDGLAVSIGDVARAIDESN
jgi:hypothetical protein